MAEQTSSSITIDAPPANVMAVIADFESYPVWAKGVQTAEVTEDGANGRAGRGLLLPRRLADQGRVHPGL